MHFPLLASSISMWAAMLSRERNCQSMQITTQRGDSIRCTVAVAERHRGVERGRGPCGDGRWSPPEVTHDSFAVLSCKPWSCWFQVSLHISQSTSAVPQPRFFFKQLISFLSIDQTQVSNVRPHHLCSLFFLIILRSHLCQIEVVHR